MTTAVFLKNIVSPRFYAMGQTGLSIEGPESIFYNPAGINPIKGNSFLFSYQTLLENSYKSDFSYVSMTENFNYGFAVTYNSYGNFEKLDYLGNYEGAFSPYDMAMIYGLSYKSGKNNYGINLKIINTNLIYEKGYSAALDLGLINNERYSLLIRNLGLPMKLNDKFLPLPFEMDTGIKYNLKLLRNYIEAKFPSDDNSYLAAGSEFPILWENSALFLRAGFNFKNRKNLGSMGAFTTGFGLYLNSFRIDYSYNPYGDLGESNKISLSYLFGSRKEKFMERTLDFELNKNFVKNKIFAVIPFSTRDMESDYGNIFCENLETKLKENGYKYIDELDYLLKRNNTDISNKAAIMKLCKDFKADYCIYGEIVKRVDIFFTVYIMDTFKEKEILKIKTRIKNDYEFKKASEFIVENIEKNY